MNEARPGYERVAAVLVRIGLRMVHEGTLPEVMPQESDEVEQEDGDADGGLLQGVDGGASGGGLLNRRAG